MYVQEAVNNEENNVLLIPSNMYSYNYLCDNKKYFICMDIFSEIKCLTCIWIQTIIFENAAASVGTDKIWILHILGLPIILQYL